MGPVQALSPEQLAKMQKRTFDQLEGEVLAGVAAFSSPNHPGHQGNQQLHGILNKDTPCGIFAKAFVQVEKRPLSFSNNCLLRTFAHGLCFAGRIRRECRRVR